MAGPTRDPGGPRAPARGLALRLLNVACRTVHIVAFAVLLGGHVWGVDGDRLRAALWGTVASGVALMAVEVAADRRWLVEVRGAVVLLKLGLLLLVPIAWPHRVALLVAVAVIAAIGAHVPRRVRHAPLIPRLARRRFRATTSSCGRPVPWSAPDQGAGCRGPLPGDGERQEPPGRPHSGSVAGPISAG